MMTWRLWLLTRLISGLTPSKKALVSTRFCLVDQATTVSAMDSSLPFSQLSESRIEINKLLLVMKKDSSPKAESRSDTTVQPTNINLTTLTSKRTSEVKRIQEMSSQTHPTLRLILSRGVSMVSRYTLEALFPTCVTTTIDQRNSLELNVNTMKACSKRNRFRRDAGKRTHSTHTEIF